MIQPKYTCVNCESKKEPYFSRSEPMGFYCVDCGQISVQIAVKHPNASRAHGEEYIDKQCALAALALLKASEAEVEELKTQLGDAKATADLWIQKAKHADETAADLKAELADTRRHLKEELEEQARLLGMSAERECDLRGKLERERAIADRLAEAIQNYLVLDENIDATTDELNGSWEHLQSSITAWKEARSE